MRKHRIVLGLTAAVLLVSFTAEAGPWISKYRFQPKGISKVSKLPLKVLQDPLIQKGIQLDELSNRWFEQKQASAAQRVEQEESMINDLVRSLVHTASGEMKKPSLYSKLSQAFKSNLQSRVLGTRISQIGDTISPSVPSSGTPLTPVTQEEIEQAIDQAFAMIPTDSQVMAGTPLRPEHLALLGKVVNALTIVSVGPLGFRPHQASCNFLILATHAHTDPDGNPVAAQGSAISQYYENIPYKDESETSQNRRNQALAGLQRVHQGVRCLPNGSLASVDSALSESIIGTYLRALREGKTQAGYGLIDISLNLAIEIFDAGKYFLIPQTSRVFCLGRVPVEPLIGNPTAIPQFQLNRPYDPLQIGDAVLSPALGPNYGSQCDLSLMRFLLQDPQNEPKATLSLMGVWAENPFVSGSPLGKVVFSSRSGPKLTLFDFVQHLVEFRNWGEGDCTLQEFATNGGVCRSMKTCEAMEELNNAVRQFQGMLPGATGLRMGSSPIGNNYAGAIGSDPQGSSRNAPQAASSRAPRNGAPNSPNTLFGVPRTDVASHCGSSGSGGNGGQGPAECSMLTGAQRNYSPDPYMNQLMQCAVTSSSGGFNVQTDLLKSRTCKISVSLTGTEPETDDERTRRETAQRNLQESANRLQQEIKSDDPDSLPFQLLRQLESRGHPVEGGIDAVREALQGAVDQVRSADIEDIGHDWGSGYLHGFFDTNDGTITFDLNTATGTFGAEGYDFYTTVVHEALHAAMDNLYQADDIHREVSPWRQHQITRSLGYHQCDPSSMNSCNDSCGYADERLTRMKDCLNVGGNRTSGQTISATQCLLNPDRCGDLRGDSVLGGGGMGGQCVGSITVDPRCANVYCGETGPCPPGCGPGGVGETPAAAGGSGPSGTRIENALCASNPDRCGDPRGAGDVPELPGAMGGGGVPPIDGPEGSPQ